MKVVKSDRVSRGVDEVLLRFVHDSDLADPSGVLFFGSVVPDDGELRESQGE